MRHPIIRTLVMMLAGVTLAACSRDKEPLPMSLSETIRVNTLAVDGAGTAEQDYTFMVLFWQSYKHLQEPAATDDPKLWIPYLASHAPQPVSYYTSTVYDTTYPYPSGESSVLYATGYAPGTLLQPAPATPSDPTLGFRRLAAMDGGTLLDGARASRCDFLGCDAWHEVWWGSLDYPFSSAGNKLYFRHLGAKLVFYADRDQASMEGKQFVRNVEITNLRMSIDGGTTWTTMYTPVEFEWRELPASYFKEGSSYKAMVDKVLTHQEKNETVSAGTRPTYGYMAVTSAPFAGEGNSYLLSKRVTDRVPIRGMAIDSCYVCNELYNSGAQKKDQPLQLQMDIRAEMSYDFNFPAGDEGGSPDDDLTFTREWKNMTVSGINKTRIDADGNVTLLKEKVDVFEPGCEYRIYIHFSRSGVNLAAWRTKWNFGGTHYVVIQGGDQSGSGTGGDQGGGETGGEGGA